MSYQGYENQSTFGIAHQIDNDQTQLNHWLREAVFIFTDVRERLKLGTLGPGTREPLSVSDHARFKLADSVKGLFELKLNNLQEALDGFYGSIFAGLSNDAFYQVNWDEVADMLLSKAAEQTKETGKVMDYEPHKFAHQS